MEKEKFLKEKINSYLKYFNYDFTPVEFQNIFQKTLSDLNTFLAKDPSNGGDFIIIIKYNLPYQAVLLYRIANCLYYKDHKDLAMSISEFAKLKTGIEIHPAAQIGDNFVIDHGLGTVIGETTVIGQDCIFYKALF